MIERHRIPLELLQLIQNRITAAFSIKHMTIQMETERYDTDDVHCDLRKLTGQHHKGRALAQHH